MKEQRMEALSKEKRLLGQLNKAIEKREKKLDNFIWERSLYDGRTYSVDKELKYQAVQKKISELSVSLEQLIKQKDNIEAKVKEKIKIETDNKKKNTKKETFNILKTVNILTNKYHKDDILTYDDLYEAVPSDIVSADLIDEIANLLKKRNINVTDLTDNQQAVKPFDKIDDEITEYERNVELQIEALLQGSYEKISNDENISESLITLDTSGKITTDLGKVETSIPPPHLPQITDVIPRLTKEIDSLLISKSRARVKEKKDISLTRIENIEPTILSSIKTNLDDKDILPYQGPKIYSKARFDNDRRLSLYAKTVGDRAEEIVIKFLNEILLSKEKSTIRWISKAGETPGWDISYYNTENQLVAIEVKGTTGDSFSNVEITANEWNAANELQERYWIYLVTGTFGINPKIQRLNNPVRLKESGILTVTPILWKIEMISQ